MDEFSSYAIERSEMGHFTNKKKKKKKKKTVFYLFVNCV
jgi:hypothetical protein